jgi:hypothetical protein
MKLTIVSLDGTVCKNSVCYLKLQLSGIPDNVHALQWDNGSGWLEFNDGEKNKTITALPDWAIEAEKVWQFAHDESQKPLPPPTAEQNKYAASQRLLETDWTTIPDVSNPQKSNPYLSNSEEFVAYRNIIRQYAVNPVAGNINWPNRPKAVWSNV